MSSSSKSEARADIAQDKFDLRGLETILNRRLNDTDLFVVDFSISNFKNPLGENNCSFLFKLDATIGKEKKENERVQNLVVKSMNNTVAKPLVDWSVVLKKEVLIYSTLLPLYKSLERASGRIPNDEIIDFLPEYYGHRYSIMDEESTDAAVDQHSCLLMENVRTKKFYHCGTRLGLDLQYAEKALSAVARYHALGVALRVKQPADFDKIADRARPLGIDHDSVDRILNVVLKKLLRELSLNESSISRIESSFENAKKGNSYSQRLVEPWVTIAHGDYWISNVFFRRNETTGELDGVKFVDFQHYLRDSPLKDVTMFLFCSLRDDVAANDRVDRLLNFYYLELTKHLELMECDVGAFDEDSFFEEVERQAFVEFPMCVVKIVVNEARVIESAKSSEEILSYLEENKFTDSLKGKLSKMIRLFEKTAGCGLCKKE